MVKKIGKIIEDNKGVFAVVPTDLSKSFDCIPHGLPIAKLNVLGFDKKSLFFISACLNKQKQKPNSGSVFSDFLNVLFGVPQGLILGPIFIYYIYSRFIFINNDIAFVSYVHDTTPYISGQNFSEERYITNIFK